MDNKNLSLNKDTYNNIIVEEYAKLYRDKLNIFAVSKCLNLNSKYYKSHYYQEEGSHHEIVDRRNKHIEACLDQVYYLHEAFNDVYYNN